ncbi:Chorion peroxidase [Amphibalanus amphitrite]|uniref:Chorion peroxidase n=1 Tax=Amphibalanus amphitrite TaxID=1232801 RepID=A0A6A4VI15_AMPAM|nr:Chorion peroxidase [Amphibalanus amphitrite]
MGRIGLQRVVTVQAVGSQTHLYPVERWTSLQPIPGCSPARSVTCEVSFFNRSLSGECNHPQRPFLGRALTDLGRISSATYEDRLYTPRSSAGDGSVLPSADTAGALVFRHRSRRPLTKWAALWTELLQRDLARLSTLRLPSGRRPDCCTEQHPACLPLTVAGRCVSFVRALPAPELDCVMRPAAPLSAASSYLDLETLVRQL